MKKMFLALLLSVQVMFVMADEGMWLPHLLGQQVYNDMVKKGLKLSKEQLYNINKASLKDAIIIFGGGCTGEIVSAEGLIFTNHHCGYGAIAAASSVNNNYLRDGFYAKSKQEEIPTNLTVQFLVRIEDVTAEVEAAAGKLTGQERNKKIQEVTSAINARLSNNAESIAATVIPHFKGNQFLAFIYQTYSDIRLVGTPPESVGKYGGDTDNWEWPRHTGDFSVFRVYMGADGKPAKYAATNLPYKAKYFLPVSLKGLKNGDYAMTWGYPGSTNRYESSFGVKLKTDIENPSLVELRDMRLKHMFNEMKKSEATKLKLASSYASIANYWKFFDGESKQLLKYKVFEQKQASEKQFQSWATGKPEFEKVFSDWALAYEKWRPYSKHRVYIREGVLGSPLMAFAASITTLEAELVKKGADHADVKKLLSNIDKARTGFKTDYEAAADVNIIRDALHMFYLNIDKSQHPIGFYEGLRQQYGDPKENETYAKLSKYILSNTILLNDEKWKSFISNPDANVLQADPAYATASSFYRNYDSKIIPYFNIFNAANNELGRLYLKGILQMEPNKVRYPDATFTMRVSYGQVKSYKPKDAVTYDFVTTASGVLEKYKAGDYEFDLPENVRTKLATKDFGIYKDPIRNDLVVGFITTNDITGGNSGSPVINGNGELIGLAFDGNYEALSHKIAFDKDLNRTICVDIRYVLWCIDKLGGGANIIKELKLVR